ncbi:MAG: hypothetical protein K0R66_365 [Gammaproteobacteria bacterium]|jgi:hypothetical protein|nr:hypothetical protein [Gammaproteobacteria bacterium]
MNGLNVLGEGYSSIHQQEKSIAIRLNPLRTVGAPAPIPAPAPAPAPAAGAAAPEVTWAAALADGAARHITENHGTYRLYAFESVAEMHRVLSGSLELTTKIKELGLSLEASASKETRVDARTLYYVLLVRNIESASQPLADVPALNIEAKRALGMLVGTVEADLEAVETRKREHTEASAAKSAAQKKLTDKQTEVASLLNTSNEAAALAAAAQQAAGNLGTPEATKAATEAQAKAAAALTKYNVENAKIAPLQAELQRLTGIEATAQTNLNNAVAAARASQDAALAGVGEANMRSFHSMFGDRYVKEMRVGRQLVALITMDRHELTKKTSQDASFGLKGDPVGELSVKGHHELDQVFKESNGKITILTDGVRAGVITNIQPKDLGELNDQIAKFLADGLAQSATPIDYTLDDYRNILLNTGIPLNRVNYLYNGVNEANQLIAQILELRNKAVLCYVTRDFHRDMRAAIDESSADPDALDQDPHNLRLAYLYGYLKQIIDYLAQALVEVKSDVFNTRDNAGGIKRAIADGGRIAQLIETIRKELQKRAGKALHSVHDLRIEDKVWYKRQFESDYFPIRLPAKASRLYFSAHVVPPPAAPAVGPVVPAPAAAIPPLPPAFNNDADQHHLPDLAIAWPKSATLAYRLNLYGTYNKIFHRKIYRIGNDARPECILAKHSLEGYDPEHFYFGRRDNIVTSNAAIAYPYTMKVRIFAAVTQAALGLNFDRLGASAADGKMLIEQSLPGYRAEAAERAAAAAKAAGGWRLWGREAAAGAGTAAPAPAPAP